MGIRKSTARYEVWLSQRISVVAADLELKHVRMAESGFSFLRATFYRWIEIVAGLVPDAIGGPAVLSIGDLHLENFGTWRDADGRLVWGINDFDEASELPLTSDLVRLATSARLAAEERRLSLDAKQSAEALLEGYRTALDKGGEPIVLAESNAKLRTMALRALRDPVEFWSKLGKLTPFAGEVPAAAAAALAAALPPGVAAPRVSHRVAGLGSLGRQRFVAVADWHGSKIARETKPIAPSATVFAGLAAEGGAHGCQALLTRSIRCPDPFVRVAAGWIVRRLAPDSTKIDVGELPRERDEACLLSAMGWETANVHLATGDAAALAAHFKGRGKAWLASAAERMSEVVLGEWQTYRRG